MNCETGFILRKAYTRKGKHVKSACIRKTSTYSQTSSNFKRSEKKRMTMRLRGFKKTLRKNSKVCPKGTILRKSYVRIPRKTGKRISVSASCIPDVGLPGKRKQPGIGPLRKGELVRFGYKSSNQSDDRHNALKKAVNELGSLSVWRKLNAIYVYNKNTNPTLAAKYNADRNWVRATYGLKAF